MFAPFSPAKVEANPEVTQALDRMKHLMSLTSNSDIVVRHEASGRR